MKPFTSKYHFNAVYRWLSLNATGECSVLVDTPWGPFRYVYTPRGPLFRRLYGPVGVHEVAK